MPDCCACRKILVSRTAGSDPAASRSRSTSPAPTEGSWSTSPTSSRCAPGGTALTSLLARITSTIEVSSTTTRSASSGCVGVEGGVAARAQLQQPVDGGRFVAGQFGEPLGGPAGGGGQHDLGALGPGQLHHRADGERLPAAGAAGQHRDLGGQGEPDRVGLFRGELGAGPAAQPAQRLVPVDGGERGQPVGPGGEQAEQGVSQGPFGLIEGRQVDGGDLRCGLRRGGGRRAAPRGPPPRPRPARPGTG